VAKSITDAGGQAIAIPGDMLNAKYIDVLVEKAAAFGDEKIHIIVNNAGFTWDGVIHKVPISILHLLVYRYYWR
jgi:3-oxoacyl-[acyl-carrier protein] reductase